MEELVNSIFFCMTANAVHFGKRSFYKSGAGGHIAGQTEASHAKAVRGEEDWLIVCRWVWCELHIICQIMQMVGKWRIVCENAYRVIVQVKTVFG